MNEHRDSSTEIKVGLFVLIGLAALASLILYFGGVGDAFRKNYRITVELPDASGLLKDSSVLLAGARIGKVATAPAIMLRPTLLTSGSGVEVVLQIDEGVRIPAGSEIQVGSAGLLGDRFVAVRPPPDFAGQDFIPPGARLAGTSAKSLEDLQREGAQLISELRAAVSKINNSLGRVESEFLGNETIGDLKQVFANIKTTSETFASVSSKLTSVVDGAGEALGKAGSAIESLSGTLSKGGETLDNVNQASEDLQVLLADARKFVGTLQSVAEKGQSGGGLISTLLNDRRLATDVGALVANLRNHGLLFYRDTNRPGPGGAPPPPTEGGATRREGGRAPTGRPN